MTFRLLYKLHRFTFPMAQFAPKLERFRYWQLPSLTRSSLGFGLLATVAVLSGCAGTGTAMNASPTLSHGFGIVNIPVDKLERDYANAESEFMEVNDYRIHYRDQGQGKPIVLLHGAFSSLHTWEKWVDVLSRQHRVITFDLPGFGLTGAPEDPAAFSRQSLNETFAEFIEELELREFILVGHGLGGEIAADYTALNGSRVDKLFLVAPTGYPQDVGWGLKFATWDPVAMITNHIQSPILLASRIHGAYGDSDRLTEEDGARYMHMSMRPGSQRMYTQARKFIRAGMEDDQPRAYERIRAPTLIMWGGRDPRTLPSQAELWSADIGPSALVVYPDAGHMPMEEFPAKTLEDAQAFLQQGLAAFPEETEAEPEVEVDAKTDLGRNPEAAPG